MMVEDKVEKVERFEVGKEFEVYFEVPKWAGFYVDDEDFNKMQAISRVISEVLLAVQTAKKVGIEKFSIIRIKDKDGFPLHTVLTKRILENFGEFLEVVEGLVSEGNLFKVELIDLNRYECETIIELLEEAGEEGLAERMVFDCEDEENEEEEDEEEDEETPCDFLKSCYEDCLADATDESDFENCTSGCERECLSMFPNEFSCYDSCTEDLPEYEE